MTTATVTGPGELETALLQALSALPRPEQWSARTEAAPTAGKRRVWTIPARVRGFTGRTELLAKLEAALRSRGPVVQAVTGMGGIGKSTAASSTPIGTTTSSTSRGGCRPRIRR